MSLVPRSYPTSAARTLISRGKPVDLSLEGGSGEGDIDLSDAKSNGSSSDSSPGSSSSCVVVVGLNSNLIGLKASYRIGEEGSSVNLARFELDPTDELSLSEARRRIPRRRNDDGAQLLETGVSRQPSLRGGVGR